MALFANMSPEQRKLLTYGAPVVAALAVGTLLAKRNKTATQPAGSPATSMPSTAVDAGQLAEFENSLGHALTSVQHSIQQLADNSVQLPPPGPAPTPTPSSSPAPSSTPAPVAASYAPLGAGTVAGFQPDGTIATYTSSGWQRLVPLGPSGINGGTAYGPAPGGTASPLSGALGAGIAANIAQGIASGQFTAGQALAGLR